MMGAPQFWPGLEELNFMIYYTNFTLIFGFGFII